MASDSKLRKYLTVYVHYNGLFAPKPLVYLNSVVVSIADVDFGAMDLKDFKLFIEKLIEGSCDNVYYCTRNEPLAEGIRRIGNDADYYEFIETGYSDEVGLIMNVYIDYKNEPVLDWADMEVVEDDEGHYSDPNVDNDKESQLSDDIPYEHEADGYIPSLDKTIGDEFLHRVSGISKDKNDELETDEVETNNGDDKPVYPVHNENQKWDKMVPIQRISKDKNDKLETDEVETNNGDDKPMYPVHNENQKWYKMVPIQAYEHLMEMDPKSWCRAFFEVDRACDAYENDISESFNLVIDLARKRPLLTMLEEIRIYGMERMYRMLLEGQSWGNLKICPYIRLKISKLKKQQRIGNDGYVVDLNNNTCGCRSWQVSGIPCVHAVAAISYLNRNAKDYVAPWFHTAMFLTCCKHTINPLNGSSMWPEAPYMKPLPPQKEGSVNRCTICRERVHNRSACPTRPADVASTLRPKNKKPKKCKKEKGKVEPVQVDPVQADPVQVPAPHVEPVQADPMDPIQVPAPNVEPIQADPVDPVQVPHVEPVDDPAPHVEPVQVDDPHPNVDVPAQPVATRQRIRKYSERITKIGLRRKVLKKEGSTTHNPMVLE
ncbi:unnamed protein product [Lactuca saligna]|uniref:SWIM-type domain-containing protein n=1 Tax=Lactuca saligna TaxID=75948 RepID=A0AA36DX01_LACSI|nr:unnamed protein product [Lactuca saligna]